MQDASVANSKQLVSRSLPESRDWHFRKIHDIILNYTPCSFYLSFSLGTFEVHIFKLLSARRELETDNVFVEEDGFLFTFKYRYSISMTPGTKAKKIKQILPNLQQSIPTLNLLAMKREESCSITITFKPFPLLGSYCRSVILI